MRIRITIPTPAANKVKDRLLALTQEVERQDWSHEWQMVACIDPAAFKSINELIQGEIMAGANVETLNSTG